MFLTIHSFIQTWENESRSTQRILDACTDESLKQEVTPQDRTLGRLAWHIVTSVHEMMSRTGLEFEAAEHDSPVPATAKEIAQQWAQASEALVQAIRTQWNDSTLLEEREMYGMQWANGLTLSILISHMIHHRGQMTVLMRQAGLKVPGVYGPAREEWSEFGMEPPAV
ncbi:DinB family protein [Brevibacillus sp. H7]|jgi:uncharacterized damage-inducible protein DinB|uniref:DinB family protein n=1 Tax=Brevibacillus sp. H7 TaxID=3349138 RepID=UPI0037FAB1C2